MSNIIEDGSGKGYKAKVDSQNRVHTRAVVSSDLVASTSEGTSYIAASGVITITNDTDNYLIYIKNNSEKDLVLSQTTVVTGDSTGGINELTFLGSLNPTGGTLLSSGTSFSPFNLNIGSANIFDGDAFGSFGTLSLTATGGTPVNGFIEDKGRHIFDTSFILPRGASLAGGIKAATGNTSVTVSISYTLYFRDKDVI